jgi:hypothetical protein
VCAQLPPELALNHVNPSLHACIPQRFTFIPAVYFIAGLRGGGEHVVYFILDLFASLVVVESLMMAIAPLVRISWRVSAVAGGGGGGLDEGTHDWDAKALLQTPPQHTQHRTAFPKPPCHALAMRRSRTT